MLKVWNVWGVCFLECGFGFVCVCLIYEVQNSLIDICVIVMREQNHISTGYHEWKGVAFAGSSGHLKNKDHPDMVG